MKRLTVGILELLALPGRSLPESAGRILFAKQFASITPQAISVWCRELGHRTHYATYYGYGDPLALLPRDLDVVFISAFTRISGLAYALARLFKKAGVLTVLGGPHAKSYGGDSLRFFDIVVRECNKQTIRDILAGHVGPGAIVTEAAYGEPPLVEERSAEIRKASLLLGKVPYFMSCIPLLSSTGCPYRCNFCVDWNTPYRVLATDRLAQDLRYIARHFPQVLVAFHDPNFGVKFDQVLDTIEALPERDRPRYIVESSLSIIDERRIQRLQRTNCVAVAAGVESWFDYSNKVRVLTTTNSRGKLDRVTRHFEILSEYVQYIQATFICDIDPEPDVEEAVALTLEFMERVPSAWPSVTPPVPLGGTPLFDETERDDRILKELPFCFYFTMHPVLRPPAADPSAHYRRLLTLKERSIAPRLLARRHQEARRWSVRSVHLTRSIGAFEDAKLCRRMLKVLDQQPDVVAFMNGARKGLPVFYQREYEAMHGKFAELIAPTERIPELPSPATGELDPHPA